jgi:formate hydrogenlyase subunit 6/NADH:ubiquinone oxidoreductase subunit I
MGLKEYLADIWEAVATVAKGMRITARYGVDPREEITLQYPEQRWEPAERFRGFLHNDVKRCTSCNLCVKVCPIDCISLEAVRGADKKMVLASYDINIGRCMYCGLCVEVCPTKSLTHTGGYEKASVERGELILHFVHEDAAQVKERVAKQVAEAAAKAEAQKAAEAAKTAEPSAPAPAGGKPEAEAKPAGEAKGPGTAAPEAKATQPPRPPAPAFAAVNPGDDPAKKPANAEEPPGEGGERKP